MMMMMMKIPIVSSAYREMWNIFVKPELSTTFRS